MNELTQPTVTKILALKDPTELQLHQIIDAALDGHATPHKVRAEDFRQLVNSTQEEAAAKVKDAQDKMSAQQGEISQLRGQLDEAQKKIVDAANQLGELQAENGRERAGLKQLIISLESELTPLRLPTKETLTPDGGSPA